MGSVACLIALLQAGATETPSDTTWLWIATAAFAALIIVGVGGRLISHIYSQQSIRAKLTVCYEHKQLYDEDGWGHRIAVFNDGPAAAESVQVELTEIESDPSTDIDVLPSGLQHMGGFCAQTHCTIPAGTLHYFDLVRKLEEEYSGRWKWGLQTLEEMDFEIPLNLTWKYIFHLTVTADNLEVPVHSSLRVTRAELTNMLQIELDSEPGLGLLRKLLRL